MARTSDRVEGVLLLVVMLGLVVALPLAVLIGVGTYHGQAAVSAQQRASRHLAVATLLENAPTPSTDGAFAGNNAAGVHARWTIAGGAERVGIIAADPGTAAGTPVPIWLTDSGDPAPPPLSDSDVTTTGVLAGVFGWLVMGLGLAAVYWTARLVLDRRRVRRWDHEWATVSEKWARS
ncbi:MAG TPA: hypothetical protein VJT49_02845 [Amycolatopsis sp.]|uniref:Rv1733c family protein n=1 Tax=Amycolatopsis sp. TaxID=37632 RepID=UPI002B47525D|nr:hypothetical protein [Amycolatopsis sp.]HKS44052.1 hypothetical protein [Amycolatopsis sp.]